LVVVVYVGNVGGILLKTGVFWSGFGAHHLTSSRFLPPFKWCYNGNTDFMSF